MSKLKQLIFKEIIKRSGLFVALLLLNLTRNNAGKFSCIDFPVYYPIMTADKSICPKNRPHVQIIGK